MEFIIGFIMGLILAQTISYIMYKNSSDEIELRYAQEAMKIKERLSEYNR